MIINAEFLGGTDIETAAKEAIDFRNKTGVDVRFNFNGVEIFVCRDDQTIKTLSDEYDKGIKKPKHDYAQILNPRSHTYVVIDREIGGIVRHGRVKNKPYKNIPIIKP